MEIFRHGYKIRWFCCSYHLHTHNDLNIYIIFFVSKDREDDSSDNDEVFHSIQAEVQIEPHAANPAGNEVKFSVWVVMTLIST